MKVEAHGELIYLEFSWQRTESLIPARLLNGFQYSHAEGGSSRAADQSNT
jgi:hypothetical protein